MLGGIVAIVSINVANLAKSRGYYEVLYKSRPIGAAFRSAIIDLLNTRQHQGTVIELDFSKVGACDLTFIDEFAVKLQVHIKTLMDCALVLSRINDLTLEDLIGAILTWESGGTRVPMLHYEGDRLLVLEGLDYQLAKTFALFTKKREVTARDIVELENVV